MFWVQLSTSKIQFLCISILQTLLHVTMERRAKISADIFARLLRYFNLSYKNLTIIIYYYQITKGDDEGDKSLRGTNKTDESPKVNFLHESSKLENFQWRVKILGVQI